MTEPPATCPICGKDQETHRMLEQQGILNHQFSSDGSLVPVDHKPKSAARRNEVLVVPGVDIALRNLLIRKGILSDSDFVDSGAFGSVPGGDREDRGTSEAS